MSILEFIFVVYYLMNVNLKNFKGPKRKIKSGNWNFKC